MKENDLMTVINQDSDIPGLDPSDPFFGENQVSIAEPFEFTNVKSDPENTRKDLLDDYETIRESNHRRLSVAMDLFRDCANNARSTENPKYVEAATKLLGEMTKIDASIMKLHGDILDMKTKIKNEKIDGDLVINNNSGATAVAIPQSKLFSPTEILDDMETQADKEKET